MDFKKVAHKNCKEKRLFIFYGKSIRFIRQNVLLHNLYRAILKNFAMIQI